MTREKIFVDPLHYKEDKVEVMANGEWHMEVLDTYMSKSDKFGIKLFMPQYPFNNLVITFPDWNSRIEFCKNIYAMDSVKQVNSGCNLEAIINHAKKDLGVLGKIKNKLFTGR